MVIEITQIHIEVHEKTKLAKEVQILEIYFLNCHKYEGPIQVLPSTL
jgi:hypothetical protein